ncbi:MAG TPA: trypsin-like peptidase domain-containing protein [Chloroflexota bacterium]
MHQRHGRRRAALALLAIVALVTTGCSALPSLPVAASPAEAQTSARAQTQPTSPPTPAPSPQPSAPVTEAMPISWVEVVERVRPSVVQIVTQSVQFDFFNRPVPQQGTGTGVIISRDGYILTNNHVVEGAQRIIVFRPGRDEPYTARLVGSEGETSDLAVIKIDAQDLPVAELGQSDRLRVGEPVMAIGNALGLEGGPTVTTGVVSALDRVIDTDEGRLYDLIQTDAPINPGNSGGPLVNLQGQVVGINTIKVAQAGAEGIGFAIAIDAARPIAEELIRNGRVTWVVIGVQVSDVTPALAQANNLAVSRGVLVRAVMRGGPAARAGILPGDIITALNGQPVRNVNDLRWLLKAAGAGQSATLTVHRNGTTMEVSVVPEAQA